MRLGWLAALALFAFACARQERSAAPAGEREPRDASPPEVLTIASDVGERLAQYAQVELTADLAPLSAQERAVLGHLVAASRPLDEILLRQAWEGNPDLRRRLEDYRGPHAEAARAYFRLNAGPWDRLDELKPFVGTAAAPEGAGFYPADLTRAEFEARVTAHPEERAALESLTTVVRRQGEGLVAVPYSQVYREWLQPAAASLAAAAAATASPSLKRFLELRARAFSTDDYYESDLAWMDVDSPVEVTIGPYETYEDRLFGYKAAFESFVTVVLPAESAALARYKERLPWLERNLPIPDEHKNFERGTESPIRVSDLVFAAGDANKGVQTVAFNLPNDERVRETKGSKKVLLRNVMRAKYETILVPIARRVLSGGDAERVSFDAFFNEVLHHELAHGLGPGRIVVDGRETEVRKELKELFSTLEEAKADVMGLYDIFALIAEGEMPEALADSLEPTYVAGLFRSARFGVREAHGQGVVAQFNYLLGKGALSVDAGGRFATVPELFPGALSDLLHEMLMIQARGDYAGTKSFLDTWGKPGPELLAAIDRLADVPVDIRPVFVQAKE
jgi:hypothetical protein